MLTGSIGLLPSASLHESGQGLYAKSFIQCQYTPNRCEPPLRGPAALRRGKDQW